MTAVAPSETRTPERGVFRAHAFPGECILVAIDSNGILRRKIVVAEADLEVDEVAQLRAWLNRHYPDAAAFPQSG